MVTQKSSHHPRVFISHAWEDKKLVRRVERELLAAGAEVWVDHSGIRGGDPISNRISDGLQWCNAVLLIWSHAASASHWVEQEWGAANAQRKKIIPCILDETKLPALLINQAYIDMRKFGRGMKALRLALNLPASKPSTPITDEEDHEMTGDQAVAVKAATKEIELRIDRDFESYSQEEKERLLLAISNLLGVTGELRIKRIRRGSVRMSLELSPAQAERLYWAVKAGALDDYGVVDAMLIDDEVPARLEDRDDNLFETDFLENKDLGHALSSRTLSGGDVQRILREKDYFDNFLNPKGKGVSHEYELIDRNGEKVVYDHATALMWQQAGSFDYMTYVKAQDYLSGLNEKRFAGFNDWRLPTLEEAMSLMERETKDGELYIDRVFDPKQSWIWTADKEGPGRAWVVYFYLGYCFPYDVGSNYHVRLVR